MEKLCPQCGNAIKGRIDKKFCSDDCRNAYHNEKNRDANQYMRSVNSILRKNRKILLESNPQGKAKVHRDQLMRKGFNFNFYTNVYQTKTGNTYYFCYEQGYLPLDNNFYALVVRQAYVV